ncbi:hypothetical protein NMG60_11030401 [Bertholletia excelsa]
MAVLNSYNSRVAKPVLKPLTLRDYLLEDLSSCSSNGFRSFPRRQCCTTVRYLLDRDLKSRDSNRRKSIFTSKPKSAQTTSSKLRRASTAVINAVKLISFPAVKSRAKKSKKMSLILPRSLSRKLLKRNFWTSSDKEIERWKSFECLVEEQEKPSDSSAYEPKRTATSGSNSSGNSCSDSDFFTSDCSQNSSSNSVSSCENDVVERDNNSLEKAVGGTTGATVGGYSTAIATDTPKSKSKRPNPEDEKEHFSPVSVLDCFFDDEKCCRNFAETKQKLMQKLRRFETLAQLEPLDLETQFALSESTEESLFSPSVSIAEEHEHETFLRATDLLAQLKSSAPPSTWKLELDILLLDFFADELSHGEQTQLGLLNVANEWVNGESKETLEGWEDEKNREAYVREMDRGGMWKRMDEGEERKEVAMEVEVEPVLPTPEHIELEVTEQGEEEIRDDDDEGHIDAEVVQRRNRSGLSLSQINNKEKKFHKLNQTHLINSNFKLIIEKWKLTRTNPTSRNHFSDPVFGIPC